MLARRPLLPEIYDMMKSVSSLVVRANATEVGRQTRGFHSFTFRLVVSTFSRDAWVVLVSQTAQVEQGSGRVEAPKEQTSCLLCTSVSPSLTLHHR